MKTLRKFQAVLLLVTALGTAVAAQSQTVVEDRTAAAMLRGKHMLSLQWISWDRFGSASVTNDNGLYRIKGRQAGRGNSDLLTIDGTITRIAGKEFIFSGTIVTKISHINGGEPCVREGEFTFRITGKRRYWRLQEMDNPCDQATDYVDIYFK